MKFNTNKFIHLSFNIKFSTSYHANSTPITSSNTHRDLGIILSSNLSWKEHYISILSKAYQTLGLLRRMFSSNLNVHAKRSIYTSLMRSQLCTAPNCGIPTYFKISPSLNNYNVALPNLYSTTNNQTTKHA